MPEAWDLRGVSTFVVWVVLPFSAVLIPLGVWGVRFIRKCAALPRVPDVYVRDPQVALGLLTLQVGLLPLILSDMVTLLYPKLWVVLTRVKELLYLLEFSVLVFSLLVAVGALQVLSARRARPKLRQEAVWPESFALFLAAFLGITGAVLILFKGWMVVWFPAVVGYFAHNMLFGKIQLAAVSKLPILVWVHVAAGCFLTMLLASQRVAALVFSPALMLCRASKNTQPSKGAS